MGQVFYATLTKVLNAYLMFKKIVLMNVRYICAAKCHRWHGEIYKSPVSVLMMKTQASAQGTVCITRWTSDAIINTYTVKFSTVSSGS